MKKILFICSGNTCRSPMAEGIFRKISNERGIKVEALSAGIFAGEGLKAAKHAICAALEKGANISSHKSRALEEMILSDADLILTMTNQYKELLIENFPICNGKIYTLKEYNGAYPSDLDIHDPFGSDLENYRKCADEIENELNKLFEKSRSWME